AAQVATLTAVTADVVSAETGLPRDRILVTPDAIDLSPASAEDVAAFVARYGLQGRRPLIGYVGRVAHEKGWPHLLELARLLADRAGVVARLHTSRDTTARAFNSDAACERVLAWYRGVGRRVIPCLR